MRFLFLASVMLLPLSVLPATIKIACIGDSITYGQRIADREENCYPAKLQQLLGIGYEVKNFGVIGTTAQEGHWKSYNRTKSFKDSLAYEPDIVLLMLGTNDTKDRYWKGESTYRKDIQHIIDSYKALPNAPEVILLTPPKAFSSSFHIHDASILKEREILTTLPYAVIDIYAIMEKDRSFISADGIHPNGKGAEYIAKAIFKYLCREAKPEA